MYYSTCHWRGIQQTKWETCLDKTRQDNNAVSTQSIHLPLLERKRNKGQENSTDNLVYRSMTLLLPRIALGPLDMITNKLIHPVLNPIRLVRQPLPPTLPLPFVLVVSFVGPRLRLVLVPASTARSASRGRRRRRPRGDRVVFGGGAVETRCRGCDAGKGVEQGRGHGGEVGGWCWWGRGGRRGRG